MARCMALCMARGICRGQGALQHNAMPWMLAPQALGKFMEMVYRIVHMQVCRGPPLHPPQHIPKVSRSSR